jgi:hypothetical protein
MASTLPSANDCCSQCNGLSVTVEIVTGGVANGNAGFFAVETLAALRAIESAAINRFAILLGNEQRYDFGPAKYYYWDQNSTDDDDPFFVVVPNDNPSGPGRWVQVT